MDEDNLQKKGRNCSRVTPRVFVALEAVSLEWNHHSFVPCPSRHSEPFMMKQPCHVSIEVTPSFSVER